MRIFDWRRRMLKPCIELLSSMRFAIALLVVLALASVIGTILKQDANQADYVMRFGPFWADVFISAGLHDVYGCAWFLSILIFLVLSLSLCVSRKARQKLAHMRSWKDHIRLDSLRTFRYHAQWISTQSLPLLQEKIAALLQSHGYRFVVRDVSASTASKKTLLAAKQGSWNTLGYFATHIAIIIICLGGLLDSHLPLQAQKWLFGKHPLPIAELNALPATSTLDTINPAHRLSTANPTFRAYAWIPEEQSATTALINEQGGVFLQELPFTLQLNRFIVEYYSSGMPKRFASDVTLHNRTTGQSRQALIEVNHPLVINGIAVYQSSFEDGGSILQIKAYPMTGKHTPTASITGKINQTLPLADIQLGSATKNSPMTLELTGFRAINVENTAPAPDPSSTSNLSDQPRSNPSSTPSETSRFHAVIRHLTQRLGSAAKSTQAKALHNIGPSIQYKIRDQNGQAYEFNQYMLPLPMPSKTLAQEEGDPVNALFFLTGVRATPAEPFRYLRIPADSKGSIDTWMQLRAALQNPALLARAAKRFAQRAVPYSDSHSDTKQSVLQHSAQRVLTLFAGIEPPDGTHTTHHINAGTPHSTISPQAGFGALATWIHQAASPAEQDRATGLFLRLLEGAIWELWQLTREQHHQPPIDPAHATPEQRHFFESSISALSEQTLYPAPIFLQLQSYKAINASVFQITKMPGKFWVYLGSFLLLLGIVILFYVRERRIWVLLQDSTPHSNPSSNSPSLTLTFAFSSPRHRLASATEFTMLKKQMEALICP